MRFPIEGSSSRSRLLTARLLAVLCTVFALGCDEDDAPPVIPPLAELSLLAPGEVSGTPPCVQRGDDARQSIVAQVKVSHFALQPPLACSVHECGTVRFTLKVGNRKFFVDSAQRLTSISTVELPDGSYTISASLLDTLGKPYESRDEMKPTCNDCERDFILSSQCDPSSEPAVPGPSQPEPSMGPAGMPDAGSMTPQTPVEVDAGSPLPDASAPLSDAGASSDAAAPDGSFPNPAQPDAGSDDALDAATPGTDSGSVAPDAAAPDAG